MLGLSRYILRQTLIVMLFVAVTFTAAIWLLQSLRLIDLIVNRGLSIGLFIYLALLILPRFVDAVLPVAVFVAVLFTYNRLTTESELVVMRASGVSPAALARPALMVGLAATVLLYALSLYLLPASNRAFKDLQFEIRNRFASVLLQDGVFNTLSENLTVYVKDRDHNGELEGLLIHDTRDKERPVTIFAERGAFAETPEGPRVLMMNGVRQQRERSTGKLSVLTFEKYTLDLAGMRDAPGLRDRQLEERYLHELLFSGTVTNGAIVEANLRIVTPLSALTMTVIPLACLLLGEFNRRGQGRRVLLAVLLAFLFETVDIGLKNMAGRSLAIIPIVYLNTLLPLGIVWWLLRRDGALAMLRRLVPRIATS